MLGAIAIFVYVGAEVSIGRFLVNYLNQADSASAGEAGRALHFAVLGGAMVGRFVGSALLRRVPTGTLFGLFATTAQDWCLLPCYIGTC